MIVRDRVYGEILIKSKIIVDLINSKPFQRLKHISQDGAAHFVQPIRNVTRYEHSIGVWYLSKKYNKSIEEQIASLLHDIPHTAFSHVIDSVVGDDNHAFHDKFTNEIILNSEIPNILKKHNIDIDKVLNKENYLLLENDLPDISVDRWDYFMRDGYSVGLISKVLIDAFLNDVKESDNVFFFEDVGLASNFAVLFLNFSRLLWLDPVSVGTYELLARAIKVAFDKKYITQEDFFTTDDYLMDKLNGVNDSDINKYLRRLRSGNEFVYANKSESEFYVKSKPRVVDPFVKVNNKLERISKLVPSYCYLMEEFKEKYEKIGVKSVS